MAGYGRMYDRGARGRGGFEGGRSREGYGGDFQGFGGMRSDGGWGGNWREFEGEEGWYGEASPGYPGGDWGEAQRINRNLGRSREEFGRGRPREERGYTGRSREEGFGRPRGDFRGAGEEMSYGYDIGFEDRTSGRGRGASGRGNRVRAAEIMTENPESVTPDTPISQVAQKMRDLDVGIIPVVESDQSRRLKGVVTDRDLAIRALAEGKDGSAKVSDCMSADLHTVNKNDDVREVMDVMMREQIRRVPVTDRDGRLVGIIAQADLLLDYAEEEWSEDEVEDTIERISEPGRRGYR